MTALPDWSPVPKESPQTADQLTEAFGLPGALQFRTRGDLVCAEIQTPAAKAVLALQGAHLISWQPAGEAEVLFLSERSDFVSGKAIRGGVPVIWPWFGPRGSAVSAAPGTAPKSPSHGFSRTSLWQLRFAALAGDDLHLSLTLSPSPESRSLGFDGFRLAYQLTIGRSLTLRLTTANDGPAPLRFEEALHTYLGVGSAEQASLVGLEGTEYLDKRDDGRRKREGRKPLQLSGPTDRVYLGTEGTCVVHDPVLDRRITVAKSNSRNTVVWNPWEELARGLPDMAPEGWRTMFCVESANVGDQAIVLAPDETHTMSTVIEIARPDESAARGITR